MKKLWVALFSIILFIEFSINSCGWNPPTPLPTYKGSCTFWNHVYVAWEGNTCVWGVPIGAETAMSGVWIHFSERNHPYSDFAGRIVSSNTDLWGFKVTGNNVSKKFAGHCIEIHGYLTHEYNHYDGEGFDQPIIDIYEPDQIIFCD